VTIVIVVVAVAAIVILLSLAAAGVFSKTVVTGGTGLGVAQLASPLKADPAVHPFLEVDPLQDAVALFGPQADPGSLDDLVEQKQLSLQAAWWNDATKTLHCLIYQNAEMNAKETVQIDLLGGMGRRRLATSEAFTCDGVGDREYIFSYPVIGTNRLAIPKIPFLELELFATHPARKAQDGGDKKLSISVAPQPPPNVGMTAGAFYHARKLAWASVTDLSTI
jgi:hypothetical protein